MWCFWYSIELSFLFVNMAMDMEQVMSKIKTTGIFINNTIQPESADGRTFDIINPYNKQVFRFVGSFWGICNRFCVRWLRRVGLRLILQWRRRKGRSFKILILCQVMIEHFIWRWRMKTILTLEDVADEESVHYELELEIIFYQSVWADWSLARGKWKSVIII